MGRRHEKAQKGRMTSEHLRGLLHKHGLTQARGAWIVGTDPRTMRRWLLDQMPVPIAVGYLFAVLLGSSRESEAIKRRVETAARRD